jgi:predicted Zn-dependent peptidase
VTLAVLAAFALAAAAPAAAQDLASFEAKTTVHTLDNGWTFILVRRPLAPVFSFATYVDVGSAQEVPGITGLAHMFEHMAFKGTPTIGTTDFEGEKRALAAEEEAYEAWQAERLARHPDPGRLAELRRVFEQRQEEAQSFVVPGAFDEIVDRAGGVGMNAFTSADVTGYFYSLPANKLELFCLLESERFAHPVFREFYRERDVVQEERRLRTESRPVGRLLEKFIETSFAAHPYHQPTVGYMSDLESFTMTDAEAFFRTYYVPANMVTAIVGDVDPKTAVPMIERYFGRVPARPEPPPLRTVEPPQRVEKTVVLRDPSQPFYFEGYHKPADTDPDQAVYDAIDDVLSNGRTSRLYRSLVRDRQLAVQTGSFSALPGSKYPNLWVVYAVPARGVSNEQAQAAIREELGRLTAEPVTAEELERFKTRAKADLIRSLDSNQGLADQLADYQTLYGDWRELFREIDRIEKVTADDVLRVARATLREDNRTVGRIEFDPGAAEPPPPAADSEAGGQEEGR